MKTAAPAWIGIVLAIVALAAACQDRSQESAPAPKVSSGTVSSNDKVSDAGPDH